MSAVSVASTTKQRRRTKAEIGRIREAIIEVLEIEKPMTCRQVFYQLVSRGAIAKTEAEYQRTVIRLLVEMRRSEEVPWGWISDQTRWIRRPKMHNSLSELLNETATLYRRNLWRDQNCHVEIWLEKDALAGVLVDATFEFGVPLMVSRGYASLSYLQATAEFLASEHCDKPCYLYHFGDHDPSGLGIGEHIEKQLREFAPEVEIHFEKAAVTPEQIEEWQLPTRPTKRTDTRARGFEGDSVDVDAIPPNKLRALCRGCIAQHIDPDAWDRSRLIEAEERSSIESLVEQWGLGGSDNDEQDEDDEEDEDDAS